MADCGYHGLMRKLSAALLAVLCASASHADPAPPVVSDEARPSITFNGADTAVVTASVAGYKIKLTAFDSTVRVYTESDAIHLKWRSKTGIRAIFEISGEKHAQIEKGLDGPIYDWPAFEVRISPNANRAYYASTKSFDIHGVRKESLTTTITQFDLTETTLTIRVK